MNPSMATLVAPLDGFPSPSVPRPAALEPVELEIERACHFKRKPCGTCGKPKSNPVHRKAENGGTCVFKRRLNCATCGQAKSHADHLGAPESFNAMAGRDPNVYRQVIANWAPVLTRALEVSGLPKGLAGVMVEGEVSFGDGVSRDAGNHRTMIEKVLGDALVRGGWLEDDDWGRFEFGNLTRREERGMNRTRLVLFPRAAP